MGSSYVALAVQEDSVGLPPAYEAWDSLGQRGAKLLLAGEALERFDARRGPMQQSLRMMVEALDAGLPQEQAAALGNKPYEVLQGLELGFRCTLVEASPETVSPVACAALVRCRRACLAWPASAVLARVQPHAPCVCHGRQCTFIVLPA